MKRRIYSRDFDIDNLPEGTKFVAFGVGTLGAWGLEAVQFMKEICKLKHRWKILMSKFIKRGQRYSTDKVQKQTFLF